MTSDIIIISYELVIFLTISFWESYIEGKNAWAANQVGWKINFLKNKPLTAYHFWLYLITIPLFLMFPFVIFGFNSHIFWLLAAGYFFGLVLEDLLWFVVNPHWGGLKKFNLRDVYWHSWLKIGKFEIPDFFIYFTVIGTLILVFLV